MKVRFRPLHFVGGLVLISVTPGVWQALIADAGTVWTQRSVANIFLLGFFAGVIGDQYILRRIKGFHTFEHELAHAIAALLFFRKI